MMDQTISQKKMLVGALPQTQMHHTVTPSRVGDPGVYYPGNFFLILCSKSCNFVHTCTVLQCVTCNVSLNAVNR